jgi:hypothetical protein
MDRAGKRGPGSEATAAGWALRALGIPAAAQVDGIWEGTTTRGLALQMTCRKGDPPARTAIRSAVALGRMGGKARAEGMSAKRRKEIAKKAAKTRWGK